MNKISSQDRSALIRLASSMPAGSSERRTILASVGYRWLPEQVRGTPPNVPNEGTDLEIWTYDMLGKFYAIAYQGKSSKHLFYNAFRSEQQRDKEIQDAIKSRKLTLESKALRSKERSEYQHTLNVGDILYSSWGYDQTNVDFYEVVQVIGKAVAIRQIEKRVVSGNEYSEYVAPMPRKYIGPALKKIPRNNSVRLNSFSSAWLWDGKPKSQSGLYGGH